MSPGGPSTALPGLFFTHVMKTAGTSITNMLRTVYGTDRSYPGLDLTPGERIEAKVNPAHLLSIAERTPEPVIFYSVHMPARVAEVVAPDHHRVTVLREPIARTLSHLRQISAAQGTPDTPEAIYADEGWRTSLSNLQTRVFADDRRPAETSGSASRADEEPFDVESPEFRRAYGLFLTTSVNDPHELDRSDLDTALARLERQHVVGVTERVDDTRVALEELLGIALAEVPRLNVASRQAEPDATLLRRIEQDNQLDLELYERARELSHR